MRLNEVGALTLPEQVNILKADLLAKFQRGDWHGVRDAAVEEIARTRTLWMVQLTFGQPFQPIALSTQRPEDMPP